MSVVSALLYRGESTHGPQGPGFEYARPSGHGLLGKRDLKGYQNLGRVWRCWERQGVLVFHTPARIGVLVYSPFRPTALGPLLGGVLDAVLSLQVGGWAVLASRQCRSSSPSGNKIARSTKRGIQSSLGDSYSVIMMFTPLPPLRSRIMPCHQQD